MTYKKTSIAIALAATFAIPTSVSADTITMTFTGKITMMDKAGAVILNGDAFSQADYGYRTDLSGTGTIDTVTGAGSATINAFSFFGGGLASATAVSFQAIGDGAGGPGSLVAGLMGFNWNGNFGIPITAVFDAAGFFGSIGAPGTTWTVAAGCAGCATSATSDYTIFSPYDNFVSVLGDGPMVMTNYNTAGTTLSSVFPLTDDGIAGSPMTTAPFPGYHVGFDFTSITATTVSPVPVPAAAWLFGSGLFGLVGVARRRRHG